MLSVALSHQGALVDDGFGVPTQYAQAVPLGSASQVRVVVRPKAIRVLASWKQRE